MNPNVFLQIAVISSVGIFFVAGDWSPPKFCRGNDCPKFTILNKTENYEVRKYESSRWASTTVQNLHDLNGAMRTGFMRLFNYITGNNEKGEKIAMTCPVRTKNRSRRRSLLRGHLYHQFHGAICRYDGTET